MRVCRTSQSKKNAGFTPEERESFGKFLESGYVDTFRHMYPTEQKFSFWSSMRQSRENNKGWRLDYFVTSKNMLPMVEDSEIHCDVMGSDHCPIGLKLDLTKKIEEDKVSSKQKGKKKVE